MSEINFKLTRVDNRNDLEVSTPDETIDLRNVALSMTPELPRIAFALVSMFAPKSKSCRP